MRADAHQPLQSGHLTQMTLLESVHRHKHTFVCGRTENAISMALASTAVGYGISREPVLRRFVSVAPALGVVSLAFGAWHALGAISAVPYAF